MCLLPSVRWGPNRDAHVEGEYVERLHQCATASSAGWAAKGRALCGQDGAPGPLRRPRSRRHRHSMKSPLLDPASRVPLPEGGGGLPVCCCRP
ncbi:hypothetical protein MTO96_042108, partial [Rhipicephalus appendiculatus]